MLSTTKRLCTKLYKRLQSVGRHGLVTQAQAAVDLALWDIKGKISGLRRFTSFWRLPGEWTGLMALTALAVYERVRDADILRGYLEQA